MVISCASMMRQRALVGVFLWGPYRGVDLQRIGAIGSCATVSRGLDETHFTWLVVGGNATRRGNALQVARIPKLIQQGVLRGEDMEREAGARRWEGKGGGEGG